MNYKIKEPIPNFAGTAGRGQSILFCTLERCRVRERAVSGRGRGAGAALGKSAGGGRDWHRWGSEEEKGTDAASGWRSGVPPQSGPLAPAGHRRVGIVEGRIGGRVEGGDQRRRAGRGRQGSTGKQRHGRSRKKLYLILDTAHHQQ